MGTETKTFNNGLKQQFKLFCHSVLIASGLEQIFINLINFQGDNDWKMLLDNIADL